MGRTEFLLEQGCVTDFVFELFVAPAFFAGKVNARLLDILPLALARGVVHQLDQSQTSVSVKRFKKLDGILGGKFAAYMKVMIRTQKILFFVLV